MIFSPISAVISAPIRLAIGRAVSAVSYSPATLFASGERGVWYDPSDLSTLFQDAAGTTPVTAVEQPVGLMLDKSGRGNHAMQSTSTKQPVLSARVNLLTKTEQFDDAVWLKRGAKAFGSGSVTNTTNITAPDGSTTVDFICEDTSSQGHVVAQQHSASVTAGVKFTASVNVAKYGTINSSRRWAYVALVLGAASSANERYVVVVDLDQSVGGIVTDSRVGAYFSNQSVTVVSSGSFWKITLSGQCSTTGSNNYFVIGASNSATPSYSSYNDVTYTGDGTSGIYIWGADLRPANSGVNLPSYQRVNTGTDYDTAGFPTYLKFDGIDDAMQTNSIDFTATDKMTVFAGVRKLSDAAAGILFETSLDVTASYPGSFSMFSPHAASGTTYQPYFRGDVGRAYESLTPFAAPITNVVAAQMFNRLPAAGVGVDARVNGVAQIGAEANSITDAGNFGNYPLYIGARAGTSLFFNGHLYSLITRGAQSTTAQIEATEQWVNGKTAAF